MPSASPPLRALCLALACLTGAACSIGVRRDFAAIPPGQIGFDDMCGLQEYFDTIEAKGAQPPTLVSALDLESGSGGKAIRGGRARYAFQGEFQLKHLRRVLKENWKGLPDQLASAPKVELEVHWSERAGVRRVITDREADLTIGAESWGLPYQVCLSELLYGEPLYRQRRVMWGLPLPLVLPAPPPPMPVAPPAPAPSPPAGSDGGVAPDAVRADGRTDGRAAL